MKINIPPAALADFAKFALKGLKGKTGVISNIHMEFDAEAGAVRMVMTDGYIMAVRTITGAGETYPNWRQVIPAAAPYATARVDSKALAAAAAAAPKPNSKTPGMPGDGALITWGPDDRALTFTAGPVAVKVEGDMTGEGRFTLSAGLLKTILEGVQPEPSGIVTLGLPGPAPAAGAPHLQAITITGLRPDDAALIMPIRM